MLKGIIITHKHNDHQNFVTSITQDINIKKDENIIYNMWQENATVDKIENQIKEKFNSSNLTFNFLKPRNSLNQLKHKNDQSLVFSVSYADEHILFTGDATGTYFSNYLSQYEGENTERIKSNRNIIKQTTLYIMPHHGSSSDDSWRWTNYICKWCNDLKASFICCTPKKTHIICRKNGYVISHGQKQCKLKRKDCS